MLKLKHIADSLGYAKPDQRRAFARLLHEVGCFGDIPEVPGRLTDSQADAVLNHVTFDSAHDAAGWLRESVQPLRRPANTERWHVEEDPALAARRAELLPLLSDLGLTGHRLPKRMHYDHVLVLGAGEGGVDARLDTLKQAWEAGVRFDHIALLGSGRPLEPGVEPSADTLPAERATEAEMMEARYKALKHTWPHAMRLAHTVLIDTHDRPDGTRADTADTIRAWNATAPRPGNVLVISSQPHAAYQDAAVKSILPLEYHVETVGAAAPESMNLNVALDALAKRVEIDAPGIEQRLAAAEKAKEAGAGLVMLDPLEIRMAPQEYQFRADCDGRGVTGFLDQVKEWDEKCFRKPILVHERRDGSRYVADGHHRVELAQRLAREGKGRPIAAEILREEDYSVQDAKVVAALRNMAEGHFHVADGARVLREAASPGVNQAVLPTLDDSKKEIQEARALAQKYVKSQRVLQQERPAPRIEPGTAKPWAGRIETGVPAGRV